MKISIQLNGTAIALRIDGSETERQQAFNRFFNHGAFDLAQEQEPERDEMGAIIIKTTRKTFVQGVANWLQFTKETAANMEFASNAVAAYFRAKAEKYLMELPRAVVIQRKRNLANELANIATRNAAIAAEGSEL